MAASRWDGPTTFKRSSSARSSSSPSPPIVTARHGRRRGPHEKSPHPASGHLLPASGEKELARDPSPREAGRGCRKAAGGGAGPRCPFSPCPLRFFRRKCRERPPPGPPFL